MQMNRSYNGRLTRPAFTLVELLVVIAIIAVLVAISTSAYLGVTRGAQERSANATLKALAVAVQAYYNENHNYPAMRFEDIIPKTPPNPWPNLSTSSPVPNADQSIAALIYQLQYRSSAGDLLKNLPSSVMQPLIVNGSPWVVKEGGQDRQLYTIRDPWGYSVQYLRPRQPAGTNSNYPLSPVKLNNRILLVSFGKDGGSDKAEWQDTLGDTNQEKFPDPTQIGTGDDIVLQVGTAR